MSTNLHASTSSQTTQDKRMPDALEKTQLMPANRQQTFKVMSIEDSRFKNYGRILTGYDFTQLCKAMEKSPLPETVVYEPSVTYLEVLPVAEELKNRAYGGLPIQIGYCNGSNHFLNAVEYHRNSELNIAVTDAILILGRQQDIEDDYTYDTSKMEMFLLPAGVGVELYGTTLHYAPCNAGDNGFKVAIVLPRGTNYPLSRLWSDGEDQLLTAVNKWLIGHEQGGLPETAFIGLKGENLSV